ncbi:MFS general substrate transporter [Phanerochaete sordida]|uniref:MFS general substrate transporter n=1 Tax=Phanerochaete sordida TaxID=48140 RepID=A0A9P3LCC0_9APHY|nr:MFS general substrate transporter [Phanerochaete sordida]
MSQNQLQTLSQRKKYFLLVLFCFVQFLDAFNFSALFAALPRIQEDLDMNAGETTWIISAFQLTFASFLLLSGRLSDVTNPKYTFVIATAGIGCISIVTGFLDLKIPFIVLRAVAGIMGAMTIPSALTLLVNIFPEPHEQAQAIGAFGGSGGVGNVIGLLVGAIFVKLASWRWIFWFISIIAIPIAILSAMFIPPQRHDDEPLNQPTVLQKINSLDLGGISLLTVSVILFIFALTEGSAGTWVSVKVLLPLVLSIFLMIGFFVWERIIPSHIAAIPPRTWFYRNFAVLFAVALLPYLWFTTMFDVNMILWQEVYGWNSLICALRMIPSGVVTFCMALTGPLARRISPKWIILTGMGLMIVANILFAYADGPARYWPLALPAIVLGDAGAMLAYTHANIAIFEATPARVAGTVGALFNGALQLGSAVGVAAVTSIETSVERAHGGFTGYAGRAAAWWFLVGIVALEAVAVAVFYRTGLAPAEVAAETDVCEKPAQKVSAEPVTPSETQKLQRSFSYFSSSEPTPVGTPASEKTLGEMGFVPGKQSRVTTPAAEFDSLSLPPRVHLSRTSSEATLHEHTERVKTPLNLDSVVEKIV